MERFAGRLSRRPRRTRPEVGKVSLVGAGPGDPSLMTLKGIRRLSRADSVYYDALVPEGALVWCRRGARLRAVGKRRGAAGVRQGEIEAAMVRDALAGRNVVRLKGGDPFVFGRGGEEVLALLRNRIPFEVVPGVSSGTGLPALAGIPLTHRGIASSAAFVTTHDLGAGLAGAAVRRRLRGLARCADTLVLFMAGAEMARVREVLLGAGLPEETPAAVIESGSLPSERVTTVPLEDLGRGEGEPRRGPVLIVIGETVGISELIRRERMPQRPTRAPARGRKAERVARVSGASAMKGWAGPGSGRKPGPPSAPRGAEVVPFRPRGAAAAPRGGERGR